MAGRAATLVIKILADAALAEQALKSNLPAAVQKTESAFAHAAIPAGIALGAVLAFGKGTIDAAAQAEQAAGAIDAVFKDQSATVKGWAADSAQAVGLSTTAYETMATILGAQLKNMGTDMADLAPMTNDLVKLGADLAAQYGGSTSDAVAALSSLLRGERDPIERYGVSINQAAINAQLAAMGLSGLSGEAAKNATLQATLALLTKQTADAQGAFARETDTASHAQQVANAEWDNAQATLGEALLPAVTSVTKALAVLARWVGQNATLVRTFLVVVGTLGAAILAVNLAFKVWNGLLTLWNARALVTSAITKGLAAAQWLLNVALSANPIGLVIIAVVALAAAFVVLWTRSETFRRIVTNVFNAFLAVVQSVVAWIVSTWGRLAGILTAPFLTFSRVVRSIINALMGVFRSFANFVGGIVDRVKGFINSIPKLPDIHLPFGLAAPVPGAPAVAGLGRAAGVATRGGGAAPGGVVINISGAIDPEGTARAVARVLAQHRVRIGRSGPLATSLAV